MMLSRLTRRGREFRGLEQGVDGVGIGRDDTIYAKSAGIVAFTEGRKGRVISVASAQPAAAE